MRAPRWRRPSCFLGGRRTPPRSRIEWRRPTARPRAAAPPVACRGIPAGSRRTSPHVEPEPSDLLEPRLERLRRLIADEVVPLEGEMFRGGFLAVEPRLLALRDLARGLGLFAPHLPRAWGGAGLALPELAMVGEVLGWSPLGHYLCNCQAPDAGNMELLLRHGSADQQRRWLAPLARGELRSCFGMTEPDLPGSNRSEEHT